MGENSTPNPAKGGTRCSRVYPVHIRSVEGVEQGKSCGCSRNRRSRGSGEKKEGEVGSERVLEKYPSTERDKPRDSAQGIAGRADPKVESRGQQSSPGAAREACIYTDGSRADGRTAAATITRTE